MEWTNVSHPKSGSARIDLSNELLYASNGDRMPKLRPRKVDVPIYPNGAHSLAFHLLGLGFGMLRVFHCFSTINGPLSLIPQCISGEDITYAQVNPD